MPVAHQGEVKYNYLDHDTFESNQVPPIQNQWYTIMDEEDVRLLWCTIIQTNDEAAAKAISIKWTVDGTVYYTSLSVTNNTVYYIFRTRVPSTGGTDGLSGGGTVINGTFYVDKRGQSFKVEMRITAALGTNQTLRGRVVIETLEQT